MWRIALLAILVLCGNGALRAQLFTESAVNMGINYECHGFQEIGGGMAWFDYDNDGWEDLYLTGGQLIDRLYRNNGDGTFSDMSGTVDLSATGIRNTMGVVTGDINNDGYREILVTTWNAGVGVTLQRNLLYLNNGDGTFTEMGANAGLTDQKLSVPCTFADLNNDGLLDIYVGNYLEDGALLYDENGNTIGFAHTCWADDLYLNNGDLTFTHATSDFWPGNDGCTLALMPTDFNRNGLTDLIVSNDFGEWVTPNRLFASNSEGTLMDVAGQQLTNLQIYGMGVAGADYDLDLDLDYYFTNLGDNVLLRQEDSGGFVEVTEAAGVVDGVFEGEGKAVGWGTFFFDFDNNRYPDLFVANGYIPAVSWLNNPTQQENSLYRNQDDGTFVKVPETVLPFNGWRSRGAAYADWNNDGALDFGVTALVNGLDWPTARFQAFQNDGNNYNYISFDLEGITCNRDAYGAQVEIYTASGPQLGEVQSGSSHSSQNTSRVHFGLKNLTEVDSVKIFWPLGAEQLIESPQINMLHTVLQDTSTVVEEEPTDTTEFINWIISLPAGEGLNHIELHKSLEINDPQHVLERSLNVFPNPVEEVLGLTFKMPEEGRVSVELLDAAGRVVWVWWEGEMGDGNHEIQLLRPAQIPTGSYLLRLRAGSATAVRRLHLAEG